MQDELSKQLKKIVNLTICSLETKKEYLNKIAQGNLIRDNDSQSHLVVSLAVYDPKKRKVFIGLHKKSGLWLFGGGHLEKGEMPMDAVRRESEEEFGIKFLFNNINGPSLLTITLIDNPTKQKCTKHFDIWYFIPIDSESFNFDKDKVSEEFSEAGWKTFSQARTLITTPSYREPIDKIEELLSK